jgi:hypothetical protein
MNRPRASADGRPAPTGRRLCVGEGRRPARSAPNEFGLKRPPADGRPAPTGKALFASAKADARRGARRMNSASRGLRPTVGLRRPERRSLRRRRPTPGAERLGEADFNRREGLGRRMNSTSGGLRPTVGLRRPGGCPLRRRRPTPRRRQRARMNSASGGLRPMVGLRRPERLFASAEADAWHGARRMNSTSGGLRPMVGLRRPRRVSFASAKADAWRVSASEGRFQSA